MLTCTQAVCKPLELRCFQSYRYKLSPIRYCAISQVFLKKVANLLKYKEFHLNVDAIMKNP